MSFLKSDTKTYLRLPYPIQKMYFFILGFGSMFGGGYSSMSPYSRYFSLKVSFNVYEKFVITVKQTNKNTQHKGRAFFPQHIQDGVQYCMSNRS